MDAGCPLVPNVALLPSSEVVLQLLSGFKVLSRDH